MHFSLYTCAHARAYKECVFYWLHWLHPLFMGILTGYTTGYTSHILVTLVTSPILGLYFNRFIYSGQKLPCKAGLLPKSKGRKKALRVFFRGDSPEGSLSLPRSSLKGLTLSQIQLRTMNK